MRLPKILPALTRSSRGATAIEYGLIVALVAIAAIGAMKNMAGGSGSLWSYVANEARNSL